MARKKKASQTLSNARNYILVCKRCKDAPELVKKDHDGLKMYHCPTCTMPYTAQNAGRKKNPVRQEKRMLKLAKAAIKGNPILRGQDPKKMAADMMRGGPQLSDDDKNVVDALAENMSVEEAKDILRDRAVDPGEINEAEEDDTVEEPTNPA